MKTLRQHLLVLGALCSAAGFVSGAAPASTTTTVKTRPATYQRFSVLQMFDTMTGKKHVIDWTCYVNYGSGNTPVSRTDPWIEGDFQVSADGIDLWEVGAQHRTH